MQPANHLPPELDPSAPDPTLEPPAETGEQPGKRSSNDYNDPDLEPGELEGRI